MNNDQVFLRINQLLVEQGKMQKDLIEHLGMERNTYTRWKRAENFSYRSHLMAISDFLQVPVAYLSGGKKGVTSGANTEGRETVILSEDERELLFSFRMAHPELQKAIMTIIRYGSLTI
ncbi:MAG: hypothetical protein IJ242_00285 [Clostridia bacterium]|nr:hypothetical protein [Clostridia bacterium]